MMAKAMPSALARAISHDLRVDRRVMHVTNTLSSTCKQSRLASACELRGVIRHKVLWRTDDPLNPL